MKVKTIVVLASAAALPLGAAWAVQPTGPEGTGWYGYNAPSFATLDRNGDGVISRDEHASAGDTRSSRSGPYSGPSWETNPPVPAP